MIDKIKQLRLNITVGGVLVILLGIILVIYPGAVITTIAQIIGAVLALIGLTQFFGKLFSNENQSSGMLVGGVIAAVGIWIFTRPARAASVIPIIIGVVLVVHGIQQMSLSFAGRKARMRRWNMLFGGGILDIICGVLCMAFAFGVVSFATQVLGIMLIYDGVVAMISANRVNHYERQQVIDAEYWDIK